MTYSERILPHLSLLRTQLRGKRWHRPPAESEKVRSAIFSLIGAESVNGSSYVLDLYARTIALRTRR